MTEDALVFRQTNFLCTPPPFSFIPFEALVITKDARALSRVSTFTHERYLRRLSLSFWETPYGAAVDDFTQIADDEILCLSSRHVRRRRNATPRGVDSYDVAYRVEYSVAQRSVTWHRIKELKVWWFRIKWRGAE